LPQQPGSVPFDRISARLVANGQAVMDMPPVIRASVGRIYAGLLNGVDGLQHALDLRPAGDV
jgi:hypothetical protein